MKIMTLQLFNKHITKFNFSVIKKNIYDNRGDGSICLITINKCTTVIVEFSVLNKIKTNVVVLRSVLVSII